MNYDIFLAYKADTTNGLSIQYTLNDSEFIEFGQHCDYIYNIHKELYEYSPDKKLLHNVKFILQKFIEKSINGIDDIKQLAMVSGLILFLNDIIELPPLSGIHISSGNHILSTFISTEEYILSTFLASNK